MSEARKTSDEEGEQDRVTDEKDGLCLTLDYRRNATLSSAGGNKVFGERKFHPQYSPAQLTEWINQALFEANIEIVPAPLPEESRVVAKNERSRLERIVGQWFQRGEPDED